MTARGTLVTKGGMVLLCLNSNYASFRSHVFVYGYFGDGSELPLKQNFTNFLSASL